MAKGIGNKVILLILIAVVCISGCRGTETSSVSDNGYDASNSEKLNVTATVFPYYDFARNIGGDYADVKLLLPPGKDSHSFEPTASDILAISKSDLFIYNGGEMEVWVDKILDSIGQDKMRVLRGMDYARLIEEPESLQSFIQADNELGSNDPSSSNADTNTRLSIQNDALHDDEALSEIEYDEHIWTSPSNAILLVNAICEAMCEAAPRYEKEFEANAAAYIEKISDIDSMLVKLTEKHKGAILVFADRFPFVYFTEEYGLEFAAAFAGCAGDTEPSAATIAGLIEIIKENNVGAVYHVEMSSTKTAEMISSETGVAVLELNSCHTITNEQLVRNVTYVDLMLENYEALKKGLEGMENAY